MRRICWRCESSYFDGDDHCVDCGASYWTRRMSAAEQRRIEESLKGSKATSGLSLEAQWISDHPLGEKS